MAVSLSGKKIAFLTANEGVEQVELTDPWAAVEKAGGTPVLIAPKAGPVQAYHHLDKGDTFTATIANFPNDLSILVYGIVDPDDAITECNDGNNKDAADNKVLCGIN